MKNKIISELDPKGCKGIADRQVEPGKGNLIPESGGVLLVESGVQLKESRIRDCLGFHYMGREKFVSPLIVSYLITRSCSQCRHQRKASFFKLKNPTQSTGYDDSPPRVLKLESNVLALTPTNIFNFSIQTMPADGPKNEHGNMGAHSEEG